MLPTRCSRNGTLSRNGIAWRRIVLQPSFFRGKLAVKCPGCIWKRILCTEYGDYKHNQWNLHDVFNTWNTIVAWISNKLWTLAYAFLALPTLMIFPVLFPSLWPKKKYRFSKAAKGKSTLGASNPEFFIFQNKTKRIDNDLQCLN